METKSKQKTVDEHQTSSHREERLVRLLPCPFCGYKAEITDESQPDRPKSWFFAWCENRPECNAWLAASSPEDVAGKWNRRAANLMEQWRHRAMSATKQADYWSEYSAKLIHAVRAKVEGMIAMTNIPLSAAWVRMAAIEEVLAILDGIESSQTNVERIRAEIKS